MAQNKARKKKRWTIVLFPVDVLFCLMAIVLIIYGVMNYHYPKRSIKLFGFQHYVISSTSMDPVLHYGDLVISKKIDVWKLQPNDIIVFFADVNASGKKIILTHFFDSIEINEDGKKIYRTRRAGTESVDSWRVAEEDLLGEYVFHLKEVGKIILFFRSPLGFRVFIIDMLIIAIIIMIKGSTNNQNERNSKEKIIKKAKVKDDGKESENEIEKEMVGDVK